MLSCCVSYTREVTSDKRFEKILNVQIQTKRELNLYRMVQESSRLSPDVEYQLTAGETNNDPDHQLIGTIEVGHKVTFDRAYSQSGSGETSEWLVGSINFKGRVYKIEYFLGFTGYGGFTGWKRLYKSFELGPAPDAP